MKDCEGLQIPTPDLGGRRGALSDWITQRWVQATGLQVQWRDHPWLEAPVGDVDIIGTEFFHRWADRRGLEVINDPSDAGDDPPGLVEDFQEIAGPDCRPDEVDPAIADFYEHTARFGFDIWSQWSGLFRPFGGLLAAIFSRRLRQLNVPLSPLETKLGITSRIVKLRDSGGIVRLTAWVRETVASGRTLYAGSYSVCRVPGYPGPCVKVAFPLPNGYALVIMWPESHADGSFTLHSQGRKFGDPGFYFFVESEPGKGWARYLPTFQETIHVYRHVDRDERSDLRTDHTLRLWGRTFLRLHYRMLRR